MGRFAILTNRKRAVVALVHSLVFLVIAVRQMIVVTPAAGIWRISAVSTSTWILCSIFLVVSAILILLFAISRARIERLYFGLCTVSATAGLVRTTGGDRTFHSGIYVRVAALSIAVLVGWLIVRRHSNSAALCTGIDTAPSAELATVANAHLRISDRQLHQETQSF